MEKFSELKRDIYIGIVEKEQETSCNVGVCLPILYNGCILECGMQRQAHITLLN